MPNLQSILERAIVAKGGDPSSPTPSVATEGVRDLPSTAVEGIEGRTRIGLPLGNLTSQLFANVYLNKFDQWVKHRLGSHYYVRYADDFIFLSRDKFRLEDALPKIQASLQINLKLFLHPDKVFISTIASGVDFLGWVHFPDYRVLRTKTKQRMFRNIRQLANEEVVQSYLGLISHGNATHLRERVMEMYWLWRE